MESQRNPEEMRTDEPQRTSVLGRKFWLFFFCVAFPLGVIAHYYMWHWLAPKFGWPELDFWLFVPITIGSMLLELLSTLVLFGFGGLIGSLIGSKE